MDVNHIRHTVLKLNPSYGTLAPYEEMYEIRETILTCPQCDKSHVSPRKILPCLGITTESPCPYCGEPEVIIIGHRTNLCFRGDTFVSVKLGKKKARKWATKTLPNLEEREGHKSNYSHQSGLIFALDGIFTLHQPEIGKPTIRKLKLNRSFILRRNGFKRVK